MVDPDFVIPSERLPPGFAQSVEQPPITPAEAKPAATIVLLRDGANGMEVLLLKRHRSSGFVPGAYVFPGGRTDESDEGEAFTAVREAFEETGVLLARDAAGDWVPDTATSAAVQALRLALLEEKVTLRDVLTQHGWQMDFSDVVYFAHWITPIAEPRRYDTRFFAARVPHAREVQIDPREMTDAVWLTPAAALDRFANGRLPMVFPTVRTLEQLAPYKTTGDALEILRNRAVEPIMPRLVRTATGVGIVIDPK